VLTSLWKGYSQVQASLARLVASVAERAPAVVAVVVTKDPGPWLEATLEALGSQDYPELSVLVVVAGGTEDPTARVAKVLPSAFVRRLDHEVGFPAAANEVLSVVEGAAFFLICHDDCAPAPDAISAMVEESYRSNAGIVSPKFVGWDDPRALLHVGMSVDKTGAVVDRVRPGEVDHGQHDSVRDVFVAPSVCMLVRADLFAELGGFDPAIQAMAEDLDLCWRAHLAGARVMVAPAARVRHLEAVPGGIALGADPSGSSDAPSPYALERRHELWALLKCYSAVHLLRVLPQAILLNLAEVLVAIVARDRSRARAVIGAWRWTFANRSELRERRHRAQAVRRTPDAVVRRLQVRGSARLSAYVSAVSHLGLDVVHSGLAVFGATPPGAEEVSGEPQLTGSVGRAFSEDADFDELDDLSPRSRARHRQRILASGRSRLVGALVVALILVIGSRHLFSAGFPLVGQFLPLPSWSGAWHDFFASWHPQGLGTTAPASPAFAVLGTVGTVLLGAMGLTEKVLVLGCIPLGAWGMSRLLRQGGSPRARWVGAVVYLCLPLPYDALAQGRWDGLVAFAATPWVLSPLLAAVQATPDPDDQTLLGTTFRGWRRLAVLGVVVAVSACFAPAMVVVALLATAVFAISAGSRQARLRVLALGIGATVLAAALCAPWVVGILAAGSHAVGILGLPIAPAGAPGWGALLRFDLGPIGGSALSWLPLFAAIVPLLVATGVRLRLAGRLWLLALASWLVALAVSRGWTGSFAPSIDVVVAPAAAAVAATIGLGVAAFERDLFGHQFGWRQVVTAAMAGAAVIGLLPIVGEVGNGAWGLPSGGFRTPLQFLSASPHQQPSRVLWIGPPADLPLGAWSAGGGLAYAVSEGGLPDAGALWAPASPGPAFSLMEAVNLARARRTVHLGRLLAPAGVRYVVVIDQLAPDAPPSGGGSALPGDLIPALMAQGDLRQVPVVGQGLWVFEDPAALPLRAERRAPAPSAAVTTAARASGAALHGWRPVLAGAAGGLRFSGHLSAGTLYSSAAPAGRWQLVSTGHVVAPRPAFGWASQYRVPAGNAVLEFRGTPLLPIGIVLEVALWLWVAVSLIRRRPFVPRWGRSAADGVSRPRSPPGAGQGTSPEDAAPAAGSRPRHVRGSPRPVSVGSR